MHYGYRASVLVLYLKKNYLNPRIYENMLLCKKIMHCKKIVRKKKSNGPHTL